MINRANNHKARRKILVVEDNKDLSWLIKIKLEQENFRVERLNSSEAALSKIKTQHYELIISDYKLSTIMSGLALLEAFRKLNELTPVIMISAHGNTTLKEKAEELGAYAFLDKPFDIDELARLVKKALREQEVCK